jgi:hypothetical protein
MSFSPLFTPVTMPRPSALKTPVRVTRRDVSAWPIRASEASGGIGQQRRRLSRVPSLNSTLAWLLPDLVSQETVVAQLHDLLHNLPCEHGEDLDLICFRQARIPDDH